MALKLIADYVSDSDTDDAIDKDSSGLPIKAIVLKNNIINACMHGPRPNNPGNPTGGESLRSLLMSNVPKEATPGQPGESGSTDKPIVLVPPLGLSEAASVPLNLASVLSTAPQYPSRGRGRGRGTRSAQQMSLASLLTSPPGACAGAPGCIGRGGIMDYEPSGPFAGAPGCIGRGGIMDYEPSGAFAGAPGCIGRGGIMNADFQKPRQPPWPAPMQSPAASQEHRVVREARISSSSDSSDFEFESVKDVQSEGDDDDDELEVRPAKPVAPKALGEMDLADLPPIQDLQISVPSAQAMLLGKVVSIVQQVVIVESMAGKPTMDIDCVLFLDKGARTLGTVHDVFGNVSSPNYVVRFNTPQHIVARDIRVGMEVYYAPQSEFTKCVLLSELMKFKGTDASWLGDVEPPQGVEVEFSDDEAERQFLRKKKNIRATTVRRRHENGSGNHVDRSKPVADEPRGLQRILGPPGVYWQMPRPTLEEPSGYRQQFTFASTPLFNPLIPPARQHAPNIYDHRNMNNNNNYYNYYRNGRDN